MNRLFYFVLFLLLLLPVGAVCEDAYSRIIDVPGAGAFAYYAQNDPLWDACLYEPYGSEKWRLMHGSGCGPTAAAMAIRHQLPGEQLPRLLSFARSPERGFYLCACSVNCYRCRGGHERIHPRTPEEFEKYLPVIFASFAAGNNLRGALFRQTGTAITFFERLAQNYGLDYCAYHSLDEALDAVRQGSTVITSVLEGIFTSSSHYLIIASVHDGWVYLLDPLMRADYPSDKTGLLDVVEPGLVRIRLEDIEQARLYGYYAFRAPDAGT